MMFQTRRKCQRQARLLVAPPGGWDHCQAVLLSLLQRLHRQLHRFLRHLPVGHLSVSHLLFLHLLLHLLFLSVLLTVQNMRPGRHLSRRVLLHKLL